jgi:hypothetical protein
LICTAVIESADRLRVAEGRIPSATIAMMGLRSVMWRADVGRASRRRSHSTVRRALMQEPKNRVKIAGLCAEIDHARTTTSRRLRAAPLEFSYR